jgi:hypothetical protein
MSPGLFHREKFHSEHEFSHYFGSSKAQNSCTEEKPRAQEALDYGPFELSLFAEETILNPRLLRNRKSNAQKSEFRAND